MFVAVIEVGDDISECINDEAIVMLNHQSTADVPVLMSLVSHANKGTLAHHVDFIMDVMFRFFPFGWVGLMHGDFFIRQVRACENNRVSYTRLLFSHPVFYASAQRSVVGGILFLSCSSCIRVCIPEYC